MTVTHRFLRNSWDCQLPPEAAVLYCMEDPFGTLGVPRSATPDEIKAKYRALGAPLARSHAGHTLALLCVH